MAQKAKVLVIITSNDKLHGSDHKTGWYLPELAHPYYVLKEAGYDLVAASEKGGKPPLDQSSVDAFKDDPESKKFLNDDEAQAWLENSVPISTIDPKAATSKYVACFIPGGHGPLIGLPENPDFQKIAAAFYEGGLPLGAICHAPCVFSEVKLSDGTHLVKGRKLTSFSNEEEEQVKMVDNCPYLVETRLGERGAKFESHKPWNSHVVVDKDDKGRILITGANPQSGTEFGKAILKAIET